MTIDSQKQVYDYDKEGSDTDEHHDCPCSTMIAMVARVPRNTIVDVL